MPETQAQKDSTSPSSETQKLVKKLHARRLGRADSTLRDINDEELGEEIANPDLVEYKQTIRG
jgi:hypothetical protein|tara:strand:+ start:209 stop:397 length:189 start_codon:yes stop_codon:yes gene_type:complete